MKIVQTLIIPDCAEPINSSLGFLSPEINWISWALSCLQLKQYYKDVELYTNLAGKSVLIDTLQLPYTKVHIVDDIDFVNNLYPYLKLNTYSKQDEPFIHVDGDVYIWDRLNGAENIERLIAQNVEHNGLFYQAIYDELIECKFWFPDVIKNYLSTKNELHSFNAGIIGGTDITFFKKFTTTALDFLNRNITKLNNTNIHKFNLIYEQHLFYCLAKEANIEVNLSVPIPVTDMRYLGYANFRDVPYQTKFIHLLGSYKKNKDVNMMIAKRLRQDYPIYYDRIINECKMVGIQLYLDIYNDNILNRGKNVNSAIATMDWAAFYQIEKKQHYAAQIVFSNLMESASKFKLNQSIEVLGRVDKDGVQRYFYRSPNSLTRDFTERNIDELDLFILKALSKPEKFKDLCTKVRSFFSEEQLRSNEQRFYELIRLRLQEGCSNNLYLIY